MDVMQIQNLSVPARLNALELSLKQGEVLGILGANGAGKSTLLHCLAGIQSYQGQVLLNGACLSRMAEQKRAQQLGFLPQSSQSVWALSVREVIHLGRLPWRDTNPAAVRAAAEATQVTQWLDRPVSQLSGGQQARVWLARVLAGQPQIILADEPIASLDLRQQQRVLQLLQAQARSGKSVMLSIHDLSLAARYCDRLALLHQGQLIAVGNAEQVLTHANLGRAFQIDAHIDLHSHPPIIMPK